MAVDGCISLDFGVTAAVLVSEVRNSSVEDVARGVWVSREEAFTTFDVTSTGVRWIDGSSTTWDAGVFFCSNVEDSPVDAANARVRLSALRSINRDSKLSSTGSNRGSSVSDSSWTGAP